MGRTVTLPGKKIRFLLQTRTREEPKICLPDSVMLKVVYKFLDIMCQYKCVENEFTKDVMLSKAMFMRTTRSAVVCMLGW